MAVFLDAQSGLQRDHTATVLHCPHCDATAPMSVAAAPNFQEIQQARPSETGLVLRCDACGAPVFLRYRIRQIGPERIEFQAGAEELERPAERFSWKDLPETVALPFRDALGCYSHNLDLAFAAMCRLTARALFADRGERERLKLFDAVSEVRELAGVDEASFDVVRRVIFDTDLDRGGRPPAVNRFEAALLLETMKDLLYQTYVRGARLRKNLRLRQFFASGGEQEALDGPARAENAAGS